jgi:hypothetical protein
MPQARVSDENDLVTKILGSDPGNLPFYQWSADF